VFSKSSRRIHQQKTKILRNIKDSILRPNLDPVGGLNWKFYFHLVSIFLPISMLQCEGGKSYGVANRLRILGSDNVKALGPGS